MNPTQCAMVAGVLRARPGCSALHVSYEVGCNIKEREDLARRLGRLTEQQTVVQFLAGIPGSLVKELL